MNTISPHGRGPLGPQGPQTRGEEVFGDIVVGSFVTVLASGGTVLVVGLVAFAIASGVHVVAAETGLLQAFSALVQISRTSGLDAERIAALLFENILFGAAVGLVLGFVHFVLRWRRDRYRTAIEAVVSPSGLAAASFGGVCFLLHVAISVAAAWALGAMFGVFLPSPADLLGGHDAGIVYETYLGGGGGDGDPLGELVLRLLFLLVFVLLVSAALFCNLYSALGWVFFRVAPWRDLSAAAIEGAVAGGASGVGALGMAMMLRAAITRYRLHGRRNGVQSFRFDLERDGASFAHAFLTAALVGSAHAVVYSAIVFFAMATFSIELPS